ncbi:MAG: nucleoside transporter C-terminal domain-containing protein [Gammaproteobacteria bacterium]
MATTLQALAGLALAHAALWALSEAREAIRWRSVAAALAFQVALALLLTRLPGSAAMFATVEQLMQALQGATEAGTRFLFGYLAGGPQPFAVVDANAGYVLALRALPVIIVMSALARLLTHWGVLPFIVRQISRVLERALGIGGALGLAAAANVFVGMTEAPLLVRPWLARLDRGELFALMVCGMSTIAGTVFVLYANILAPVLPGAAGHLLSASLMSLPAALGFALLLVPARGHAGASPLVAREDAGAFDALTAGTLQGLTLFLNILAMLLVLVALVHLLNGMLALIPFDGAPLSLERMLGWLLAPVCWLMGIPWAEAQAAGALLGIKVVLNELLAYLELAAMPASAFGEHTRLVLTYALCGFANIGSLGMLIAALGVLVPERRTEVIALGWRSVVVGTLATCSTGAVVGLVAP